MAKNLIIGGIVEKKRHLIRVSVSDNLYKAIKGSTIFVEEVRNGRMKLAAQTLYKLPRTIDVSFIKNAPELYAHSDPGTIKIVDVKNEIVKQQLFKEIDSVDMQKIKGTAYASSQVVENPMTEHGSSRVFNIPQTSEKSSSENRPSGMLYDRSYVEVDGIAYECKNGVLQGFKDAVTENKELKRENQDLKNEIVELHKQLENNQSKSNKKKHSDNWEYS